MACGKIGVFDIHTDSWELYTERLEQYFLCNKVEENLKVPTLITVMGADSYELLGTLCAPVKPATKKYSELVALMQRHLQPKPSVLAERFKFRQRKQNKSESIADYVADLKKLTKFCEFGSYLEESLRDQFVCGIYNENIRQRLFVEENMKWNKALELAMAMEAAEMNAAAVDGRGKKGLEEAAVCKVTTNTWRPPSSSAARTPGRAMAAGGGGGGSGGGSGSGGQWHSGNGQWRSGNGQWRASHGQWRGEGAQGSRPRPGPVQAATSASDGRQSGCRTCGAIQHASDTCKYRFYVCRVCNKQGHLQRMCPMLPGKWADHHFNEELQMVNSDSEESVEVNFSFLKQNNHNCCRPYTMCLEVNNKKLLMEIDTGSMISCINADSYYNWFPNVPLMEPKLILRYYTGEKVSPLGKIIVTVKYNNSVKELELFVVSDGKTNLLGRKWIKELGIKVLPEIEHNYCKSEKKFDLKTFSSRFAKVFSDGLGYFNGGTVSLAVRSGTRPVYLRARPLAYALREPVERALDQLTREGVITPVETSDWATPIVPVVKPDGNIRICGDYKISVNKYLEIDRFPLPRVEDLFSKLHGGERFTKIDLSQAYAQLGLDESSKPYTVINTHKGLFKYNRLVYGLSSSPGIFQRKLEQLFSDMERVGVFLDDVIITGKNEEEHLKTLYEVFERLEKYGLKIKREKCTFMAESVTYLGYVISKEGVHTCTKKIEAIKKVPVPTNVSELRAFLGMVMYYAKFIKNISTILTPLYELLKKGVKYEWSASCEEAFIKIKNLLTSSEVLAHYDPSLELILTTDASSVGVGAVISHVMPDGAERPIAYASRVLNTAEKGYAQIDREALAIIYGVKKFHQYLYGRKFILRTDHKPLVTIFGEKTGIPVMAASRMQRWALILAGYTYQIQYVATDKNGADALSRLPHKRKLKEGATEECTYLNFVQTFLPVHQEEVRQATERDEILRKITMYIQSGWPSSCPPDLQPYWIRRHELYMEDGCIMWGYRIIVPDILRSKILQELHTCHLGMVKMKCKARSYVWWPGIDADIERLCKECITCIMESAEPPKSAPKPWPYVSEPWSRLHVDFLGPYEGKTFLIIIDSTTKWIEAFLMPRTTGSHVCKILRETFARFGLPTEVVSDNGPPFTSHEIQEFMKNNGIKHTFTPVYHPASNGAAENAVKLCKKALKKAKRDNQDLDIALQAYLMAYRNIEHATTGQSPASLMFKKSLRSRLDLLRANNTRVQERVTEKQNQQVQAAGGYDRGTFAEGEEVWSRDFRSGDKWVAGRIEEVRGSRNYIVKNDRGQLVKRHIDQLKKKSGFITHPGTDLSSVESPVTSPSTSHAETSVGEQEPATLSQTENPVINPPIEPSVSRVPDHTSQQPCYLSQHRPSRQRNPVNRYGFEID